MANGVDADIVDEDEFELGFQAVLVAAASYAGIVREAIASLHPPDVSMDQMPESTVWRLHLAATASYFGAIQCLRHRQSALGGYILVRGMLEAWAHLDFIADSAQGGPAALRAIRYELGAHQEWEGSAHEAPGGHPSPLIAQDNFDILMQSWKEKGGVGRPALRRRSHVQPTLTVIASREGFDWLRGLYRSTSAVTHLFGVNFLLASEGETTSVVWSTPAQRSSWLIWATVCFEWLSRTAAALMGGSEEMQVAFNRGAHVIVDDPRVRSVLGRGVESKADSP